jgi:purine-cytosine permease-like protein
MALMGHRTGVNQMVLARAPFGRRGGYLPAFLQLFTALSWVGINTYIVLDLALGVLKELGIEGGTGTKYVLAVFIMLLQILIGIWGFYAIRTFEKYTVPLTLIVLVAMSIVAWSKGNIDWSFAGKAHGADRWTAISQVMTAIGIGWGITWLAYASDYSRFVPRTTSRRKLFTAAALGQFLPTIWLGVLGASIATTGTGADPAVIIVDTFGALSVPVLLLVIHGPIATNILNVYSTSVAALAVDIRIPRQVLAGIVGVFATALTILLVFKGNIAENVDSWLAGVVGWVSPWAAIMLVHYYWVRREDIDVDALYQAPAESRVGDVNWAAVVSLVVGLIVTWMCLYGLVAPLQGPIAKALDGVDLSWAAGLIVTGGLYYTACRLGYATSRRAVPA